MQFPEGLENTPFRRLPAKLKFSSPSTAHVHCLVWGLYYCGQKSSQIKYEFINRQAPITKRKRWQLHRHCRPAAFRAEAIGSTIVCGIVKKSA